jgi:1-acyl-sn-glycerol-3-phosphate acyltransferase
MGDALADYRTPFFNRAARFIFKPPFRGLFRLLADVRVSGFEHIPARPPYLVAFNHISSFDPPFLLAFWPVMLEVLGASDIWKRTEFGQNMLVRAYGAVPVHRGEYDRVALQKALWILRSGYPLVISPEGGRTRHIAMRKANPGIAYLAEQAQVAVVPVALIGTTMDFLKKAGAGARPRLEMRVGAPIQLPPLHGRGESMRLARQQNADLVMNHIAGLLPEEYRGVYADTAILPAGV